MEVTDTKHLKEWVEIYTDDLYSWALHKVSDAELAKDMVQDTFLAAAEKVGGFKGDSSPKTWLYSILNHKIIDYYRKKVRQPQQVKIPVIFTFFDEVGHWRSGKLTGKWEEPDNEHLLDNPEFQEVLKECLEELPEKWNTCIRLKYLLSKKGEEICQELDITPTNFWQIIHRAKLQLRKCVDENWFNK
ncbi:MAG: sigma-70 family RNA polymerase sigma factor [Bacteroidales bacterium]